MALSPLDPGYCPAPSYATAPRSLVSLPGRAGCHHDTSGDCDVHGCPFCQWAPFEQNPWIDPCATCAQLREAAFRATVALNPLWQCELEDCLHCTTCNKCAKTGEVCRECGLCLEHQDDDGLSPCEEAVWSKARRREVEYFRHTLLNPDTGRWRRQ